MSTELVSQPPKRKPARVQVDPDEFTEDLPPQTGTVFNIWYNKWSGGGSQFTLVKAKYKLNVERDTGYTKADKLDRPYFCLFFAKGMCCKGKKCEYLHRVPTEEDVFPLTVDCFGREKFADFRDDMSGVGSFNTVNKTLYIGGLVVKDDTQELLRNEFRKFGKIAKMNIISNKNCGFVTFKDEANAQFAKEAMMGQSLYGTDILNVKWAHEDPNPAAVKQRKRELELETQEVVKNLLEKSEAASKKQKLEMQHNNEPVVDVPDNEDDEQITTNTEVKQIEASKNTGIFNGSSLEFLKHVKRQPAKQTAAPLITGYESSDDE